MDLVVIGNLLIDELPDGVVEPGGAALYVSLAAARAGARVGLHSVVGTDYPTEALEKAGVTLSLRRLPGPGGRTIIRYPATGRSLEHVGPGHHTMTPQETHPFESSLVVLAPMPWEWQLYHLDRCPPGGAFLDPYPTLNMSRWQDLRTRTDKLRLLVLNEEELEMDIEAIPKEVPVLLKEGSEGGYCRFTGERWEAVPVEVKDPTGAGDSFLGALAAGLALGRSWEDCLRQGAESAASVIGDIGARSFYSSF